MPWVNFIFLMIFLCFSHLKTQFSRLDPSSADIDVTGAQMVLVMKLTSFAWSYRDGQLYKNDREKFNRELNQFQRSRAIINAPSIISYLGYVFFYASLVTGPSFDYADYERFILTDVFNDVPESKRPGRSHKKRKIPKSGRVALLKVAQGVLWAALMFQLKPYFRMDYVESVKFRNEHSLIYMILYLWGLGFTMRLKYYTAWLVSEAACIVCGLGYNGYDASKNKLYWNRVQNVDTWGFEFGQDVHDCLEAWNMNTNKWLKNHVYLRCCNVDPKTGKPITGVIPTFATFLTSAFWHGTIPGYYMTFVAGAIIQTVGKIFRRNLRPMFITKDGSVVSKWKPVYDVVCWIVTQATFGYITIPFLILDFGRSLRVWSSCYFWVHIGSLVVFFLFDGPYKSQVKRFCQQYFLKATAETKPVLTEIPKETKLAELEKLFGSQTDVREILKTSNESQQSLPTFDNQDELQDQVALPDFDQVQNDLDKISTEFQEWKLEALKGKPAKELTDEEIQSLKKALQGLQSDVNYYLNSLDAAKKEQ
ncbi:DEKNAAC102163 [Brettanomyces naardenensis]|uniref:DEKNAAC102163 n=1 Tax=Brettanomyces naardenensis TaxID=13370 RepID=A0A448YJT5_BRENA|nr:DEKNAAC102163 [Brettanomyces naardenensis]